MQKIIEEISSQHKITAKEVSDIITEYITLLHKEFYEGKEAFIGVILPSNLSSKGYFHFLGIIELFVDKYDWEPGHAYEYLYRLGQKEDWVPFSEEMRKWSKETP